jgi:hypothetical protein
VVTHFRHNEHVDTSSSNDELVLEPSSFPVTIALFDADSSSVPILPEKIQSTGGEQSCAVSTGEQNLSNTIN